METFVLTQGIQIISLAAVSFPDDIADAHTRLHSILQSDRNYFGLSRPENGVIQYKAAAEELFPGEGEPFNLQSMTIKEGTYAAITVDNYTENVHAIGKAFEEILALNNVDPQGYCIECYLDNGKVRCMVRLSP